MLSLKSFFRPGRDRPTVTPAPKTAKPTAPPGYYLPMTASELLATTRRQQWLQSLWDYSSLPKEMYRQYYLVPLERCIILMQQFPLAETGLHARPGGMADYMLETVSYAARLSKSYMLPVGAPPEEQAAQSAAWNAVVVYAAMLSSLESLCHLHVELESGKRWFPLLDAPPESYRFRFVPELSPERQQSFGAMMALRIMPLEAIDWLSTWPEAVKTLSTYLTGFRAQSGVINAIISEAVHLSSGISAVPKTVDTLAAAVAPLPTEVVTELLPSDVLMPAQAGSQPALSPVQEGVASIRELISAPVLPEDDDMPEAPDDTDMLLAIMGYEAMMNDEPESQEDVPQSATNNDPGDVFWQWLITGCGNGSLAVNTPDARIHLVAGFVFLRTPGIFHQFLSERGTPGDDRARLQRAFEQLGHHRQDNGTMYTCHLYQNEQREGRFQKLSGYLVLASKVYGSDNNPGDNPLLIVI
ncbi:MULTISPECIES: TraI domain-containing protein [Citrobacter]|jgi:integrating conjugative element relaxase (TIGR03760 family)|uniref:TraI domain-containing protein n=1 Tax=Citrobacter TaxID=544 RepID=UPI0014615A90|nr:MULTISPECIES: TraI domain-containing protein [Citrobacter]MBJ9523164.1 TraI domain-containing protein [Citrobacter braakii]NMR47299.1 DNA-binding domain-containing protein [Citrobacter braakii]WFV32868.1 TraI domain-containing protein [Citrobacter braakii]